MITYEDGCVGCPPHMGCLGSLCPNRNIMICTCDKCGDECDADEFYEVGGEMICENCLEKHIRDSYEEINPHCEKCGKGIDEIELYDVEGETLCIDCAIEAFEKVDVG